MNKTIYEQKYEAYHRLCEGTGFHVAHYDRGRGTRMYICMCAKSIRLGNDYFLRIRTKRRVRTNFQQRSKYNIGRN